LVVQAGRRAPSPSPGLIFALILGPARGLVSLQLGELGAHLDLAAAAAAPPPRDHRRATSARPALSPSALQPAAPATHKMGMRYEASTMKSFTSAY